MLSLIRKINQSQQKDEKTKVYIVFSNFDDSAFKDEVAWHKDKKMLKKVEQIVEKQLANKQPKKTNAGQFKTGNKYAAVKNTPKRAIAAKPQVAARVGLKRKGRLPSKLIQNKLGRMQTVYYRPDKKSKSMYVNTKMHEDTGALMKDYRESFKRMLFLDHDDIQNWRRAKGADNHAWGAAMVEKLDKLADKYNLTFENFDGLQDKMVRGHDSRLDRFFSDAEKIYQDLYGVGDRHPMDFLERIFDVTKRKLHTRHNRAGIEAALAGQNIVPAAQAKNAGVDLQKAPAKNARKAAAKQNKAVVRPAVQAAQGAARAAAQKADQQKDDNVEQQRNVKTVINDTVYVKNAQDFLKKFKF